MQHLLFLASVLLPKLFANPGLTFTTSETGSTFNPLAFRQHWNVANCPGVNRAENTTVNLALRRFPTTSYVPDQPLTLFGRIC